MMKRSGWFGPVKRLDQSVDDVVGDELPRLDEGARSGAGGRVPAHGIAENVAGGDVFETEALAQQLRLGALAAAGWSNEDEAHGGPVLPEGCRGLRVLGRSSSPFILGKDEPRRKSWRQVCNLPRMSLWIVGESGASAPG